MTESRRPAPTPGPLKVLVAVGAVPDRERELENILDSLESARRSGNAYVRVLEIGSPEQIGAVLRETSYHILHVAARTEKGALQLEDEDGNPVRVRARELAEQIQESGHRAPLVFVVCRGGGGDEECAGFVQDLLESGVPAVLAMQMAAPEPFAAELVSKFYEELARAEQPLASRALEVARKQVESPTIPSFFVSGEEQAVLDRSLPQISIHESPPMLSGVVSHLNMGELVGRRSERRDIMRMLTEDPETVAAIGRRAGCQILGTGGIGKTALAGRIIERLSDRGWRVATVSGAWDLGRIANAMGAAVSNHSKKELAELARSLSDPHNSDEQRLQRIETVLADHEVVLVLDHFEDTLDGETGEFRDIVTGEIFAILLRSANRGKLLITSRYAVPNAAESLYRIDLGPLSGAEVRSFMLRHRGLRQQLPDTVKLIELEIGGHPGALEYLDALLRLGNVRIDNLHERLQGHAAEGLVEELVRVTGRNRDDLDLLWQATVFPFPVPAAALTDDPQQPERVERLAASSLLARVEDSQVFVQRWTAELLKPHIPADDYRTRCLRAAEYLKNRGGAGGHRTTDWTESIRLFLAAQEFDSAVGVAQELMQFLQAHGQTTLATDLAREVGTTLPEAHPDKQRFMVIEGDGLTSLGFRAEALKRYSSALEITERLLGQEPGRADALRNLLVVYNRSGDLESAVGDQEKARELYEKALQIAEQMLVQEPGRAEYLRDLSVSYNKLGDFERASGEDEPARQFYEKALEVRERLLEQEPGRAEYLYDVCISYERMADIESARGEGERARQFYDKALQIRERLYEREPGRADALRSLLVSYNRMGDFERVSGQSQRARESYDKALDLAQRLVEQEPARADYLRDLSVSYNNLGDFERALGKDDEARQFYEKALEIRERLVQQAPGRADYRLDLARSLARFSDAGRLQRAWEILASLRELNQLPPEDLPVLQFVEDRLRRTKTAGMGS